ncbi:hypothetical protein NP493_665g02035 [Ridgeia piscesae]|uniref:DUF4874 domain-containing protein n=1 Tax=Ridgeia piscesae TaxID=27915 RepID=A0AAD9NN25_RIDPI|nr:hypothetical protein NP493_665g02035 [Ridgeia piscesae]
MSPCPGVILIFILLQTGHRAVDGACSSCSGLASVPTGYKELTYSESNDHIENPNRGFVMQDSGRASNYEEIYIEDLDKFRNDSGLTLHWRQYILDDFVTSDITDDYLDKIR